MPSTKELRRRIRSVKNTAQITKAMQMVAATKMRRAQNIALNGRPYSETLQKAIIELMPAINLGMNPLLQENNSTKTAVLLLTTDKSLCGALNSNVLRLAQQFCSLGVSSRATVEGSKDGINLEISRSTRNDNSASLRGTKQSHSTNAEVVFFTLGKKGRDFVVKTGKDLEADFENFDVIDYRTVKQIANILIQSFLEQKIGEVYILYPDFVSTLKQEPKLEKILPISQDELLRGLNINDLSNSVSSRASVEGSQDRKKLQISRSARNDDSDEFIFDTSKQQLLNFVLTHFIQQKIYQSMLETKASEHSARMIAMKNATDSASDLVTDLNLAYNRTRQEGITKELLEITSALAALD